MKLSISIPTYNRSDIIDTWLTKHAAMLNRHNIDLYISDNKSNDATKQVVQDWSLLYDNIYYSCTETTLKAEYNFERCVNLPGEGWVWMVGDSYEITEATLLNVVGILDNDTDYQILNLLGRVRYKEKGNIPIDTAVSELAGVLSCISCVIYNIDRLGEVTLNAKQKSFYPHMLNIFDGIQKRGEKVKWHQDISLQMLRFEAPRKNWANTLRVYEIGVDGWIEAINTIQGINEATKLQGYKQFGKTSGLFKLRGFIWLRAQGLIDVMKYRKYKDKLKKVSPVSTNIILLISIFPKNVLQAIYQLLNK